MPKPKTPEVTKESVERSLRVLKKSQDLSLRGWTFFGKHTDEIFERVLWLLNNATKEEREQVTLAVAIIDKLVPDAPSPIPKGTQTPLVAGISINLGADLTRESPIAGIEAIEIK